MENIGFRNPRKFKSTFSGKHLGNSARYTHTPLHRVDPIPADMRLQISIGMPNFGSQSLTAVIPERACGGDLDDAHADVIGALKWPTHRKIDSRGAQAFPSIA